MSEGTSRFLVEGRVQGVGFRWFVVDAARRLELAGSVRNLPDGTVEILASGDAERLEELYSLVSKGPPGARVMTVRRTESAREQTFPKPFHVAR